MTTAIDILQAFAEPPPPLDFVLPGLLAGTVGAIVSPGGAGKSMLSLELATMVATGLDLSGFGGGVVRPLGKVVFMAAEDPQDALQHRLHALGMHVPAKTRQQLADGLQIIPLVGKQANIEAKAWLQFIESWADGTRLMFLDTLRRFHQLDENDSGQMARLIGILEGVAARTGCTILFLHHASKSAAMNGQGDMQQASRGSSVLVDNIRWQMYLAGMSKAEAEKAKIEDDKRGLYVRAGISKQNYGPPISDFWMERAEGGVLIPCKIGKINQSKKAIATTKKSSAAEENW